MSRKRSEEEYRKTKAFHFWRWLSGSKDPYLGEVEMQPQVLLEETQETILERMKEKQMIHEKVYDRHNKKLEFFKKAYRATAVLMILWMTYILLLTVSNLPPTGNANNPDNNEVSARYIEQGLQETGSVNIVTGMILTYRAFDTFGETNVLFIATVCVMVLLMIGDEALKQQEKHNDRRYEPNNDLILKGVASVLVPFIFLFGAYIILNGHLSPGGGFSGGAVLGAGLILYASAFGFHRTEAFFNEGVYKTAKVTALMFYGGIGLYYYYIGGNGLESIIPLGVPGTLLSGGIIFFIDICVGIEVACTMYAFYALFRRGGL